MIQAANHHHQHFHSLQQTDLNLNLAENYLSDSFFQGDIIVNNNCHLLFTTDKMLHLLSHAKNWFTDATFKIGWHQFTQLLSINAFIKSGDCLKQVPLLFVVMSGKCKKNYKKILKVVKCLLPSVAVKTITTDLRQLCGTQFLKSFLMSEFRDAISIGHRQYGGKFKNLVFKYHTTMMRKPKSSSTNYCLYRIHHQNTSTPSSSLELMTHP